MDARNLLATRYLLNGVKGRNSLGELVEN